MTIVHACTISMISMVHPCTMAIVNACTMATVKAPDVDIVHACTTALTKCTVHACAIAVVPVLSRARIMFDEIHVGSGAKLLEKQKG